MTMSVPESMQLPLSVEWWIGKYLEGNLPGLIDVPSRYCLDKPRKCTRNLSCGSETYVALENLNFFLPLLFIWIFCLLCYTFLDVSFVVSISQFRVTSSFPLQLNCTAFSIDESDIIILQLFSRTKLRAVNDCRAVWSHASSYGLATGNQIWLLTQGDCDGKVQEYLQILSRRSIHLCLREDAVRLTSYSNSVYQSFGSFGTKMTRTNQMWRYT